MPFVFPFAFAFRVLSFRKLSLYVQLALDLGFDFFPRAFKSSVVNLMKTQVLLVSTSCFIAILLLIPCRGRSCSSNET